MSSKEVGHIFPSPVRPDKIAVMDHDAPEIEVLNFQETVTIAQVALRMLGRKLDDVAKAVALLNVAVERLGESD